MKNDFKNRQGGFLQIIIAIIVIILVMSYFHITISGIINWFIHLVQSVF